MKYVNIYLIIDWNDIKYNWNIKIYDFWTIKLTNIFFPETINKIERDEIYI